MTSITGIYNDRRRNTLESDVHGILQVYFSGTLSVTILEHKL